jgi:hypothetical protein
MITAHNLTGGPSYTAEPTEYNYRMLLCAVFLQAVKESRWRRNPYGVPARLWLACPETVQLAEAIGVKLPGGAQ